MKLDLDAIGAQLEKEYEDAKKSGNAEATWAALKRFAAFVNRGEIPPDKKPPASERNNVRGMLGGPFRIVC